jgi:hypothetical protein
VRRALRRGRRGPAPAGAAAPATAGLRRLWLPEHVRQL